MPITLAPYKHQELCHGYAWTIEDEDALAEQIASVALGQAWHVQKILAGSNLVPNISGEKQVEGAIKLLTVSGATPWHRDGWMFQVMSWIAALNATPNGIIRFPHMIHAHKGFDGLQVEVDEESGDVIAAVIFEDKATDDPRGTIRTDVWNDFRKLEAGDREPLLVSEVTTLLLTRSEIDADSAIEKIIWKEARRYRVCITVDEAHATEEGRGRLFAGYDTVAIGPLAKRRAETIKLQNLRVWMEGLAQKSIAAIRARPLINV